MIRIVLGDLAKLRRPIMLWLSLGIVAMMVITAFVGHETAALQWQIATDSLTYLQKNPPPPESYGLTSKGARYQTLYRQDLADARSFIESTRDDGAVVAATQHTVGALGFALGHLCSIMGFLFILLIAAAHVAGEWHLRTIKEVLLAEGRRYRFVLAKCVAVFLVSLWYLLISWAALIVWNLISRRLYVIPNPTSAATTLHWTLSRLEAAPLVLLFASIFAVFFALLVRSGLGAVLGGAMTLTVLNVATRSASVEPLSPAAWVASLMGFESHQNLLDHLWAERSVSIGTATSVVWLVMCSALLLGAAVMIMKRRDVLP